MMRRSKSGTYKRHYALLLLLLSFLTIAHSFAYKRSARARRPTTTTSLLTENDSQPLSDRTDAQDRLNRAVSTVAKSAIATLFTLPTLALAEEVQSAITRDQVGFIDLNVSEPVVTDVCYFDVQVGDDPKVRERFEISLYGTVCPKTCENFKLLASNKAKAPGSDETYGYKGSELFRVISSFSVQGGNIGAPADAPISRKGRYGRSAISPDTGFPRENFRILHSYKGAGIISMMREITNNNNMQDSRFFITFSPYASWADDKYTAFGRVSSGMQFIQSLQIVPVQSPANYPLSKLTIVDSGVIGT